MITKLLKMCTSPCEKRLCTINFCFVLHNVLQHFPSLPNIVHLNPSKFGGGNGGGASGGVKEQLEIFKAQRDAIAEQSQRLEEQSREARDNSGKLALEVDKVLKENKTQCDEQIAQQVGKLRSDVQDAVTTVNEKIK